MPIDGLTEAEEIELLQLLEIEAAEIDRRLPIWSPKDPEFPEKYTPQMALVDSKADIIFYGGGVGGGKTFAAACIALTQAETTLILRREFSQHEEIVNVFTKLIGAENVYGGTVIRWKDEKKKPKQVIAKKITLGHLQHPKKDWQKYQGRQFQQVIIDEATGFPEDIVRLLMAWNRKPAKFKDGKIVKQKESKIKTIFTFNPPITHEGLWIIKPIAPWIDPSFRDHNGKPLRPAFGELLYVLNLDNQEYFFTEHQELDRHPVTGKPLGEVFTTVSRTYIKATLNDNAYLRNDPVYKAKLQAMPAEWRKAMLDGEMTASLVDQILQIFKGEPYKECLARWRTLNDQGKQPKSIPLAVGLDTAQGGNDDNALVPVWERGYFGEKSIIGSTAVRFPDEEMRKWGIEKGIIKADEDGDAWKGGANGISISMWVERMFWERWECLGDQIPICVDAIGGADFISTYSLAFPKAIIYKFRGNEGAGVRAIFDLNPKPDDKAAMEKKWNHAAELPHYSIGMTYTNKITCAWGRLGDATRHPEFAIALPPDTDTQVQLTTRVYKHSDNKRMGMTQKEKFIEQLGNRSPNEADATVMAYYFIDVVLYLKLLPKKDLERFEEIQRLR